MKLHLCLLNKIHEKLKQPYNDLNLELSYFLNHQNFYYIDSYTKYYLTEINSYKITKFMNLCNSDFKITKYLVQRGADIHFLDEYGLRKSCENGYLKNVKFLLSNGSNVHVKTKYALRKACKNNYPNIIKVLLKNNISSDLNPGLRDIKKSIHGEVLIKSCKKGYFKVAKILLKHWLDGEQDIGVDINTEHGKPLTEACRNEHIKIVKLLIKYNSDVNINNNFALSLACASGNLKIIKVLFRNGSDANNCDFSEYCCLSYASINGHLEIIKLILKLQANIKLKFIEEAFKNASKYDHLGIVKFLSNYVNNDITYEFALLNACSRSNLEIVKFLLESRPSLKSCSGCFQYASENNSPEIFKLLLKYNSHCVIGTRYCQIYETAWNNDYIEIIKCLENHFK